MSLSTGDTWLAAALSSGHGRGEARAVRRVAWLILAITWCALSETLSDHTPCSVRSWLSCSKRGPSPLAPPRCSCWIISSCKSCLRRCAAKIILQPSALSGGKASMGWSNANAKVHAKAWNPQSAANAWGNGCWTTCNVTANSVDRAWACGIRMDPSGVVKNWITVWFLRMRTGIQCLSKRQAVTQVWSCSTWWKITCNQSLAPSVGTVSVSNTATGMASAICCAAMMSM